MIDCFTVFNAAENRLHHFLDEGHADRYATHLGEEVAVDISSITELTTMRRLLSDDHLAECGAQLAALGA